MVLSSKLINFGIDRRYSWWLLSTFCQLSQGSVSAANCQNCLWSDWQRRFWAQSWPTLELTELPEIISKAQNWQRWFCAFGRDWQRQFWAQSLTNSYLGIEIFFWQRLVKAVSVNFLSVAGRRSNQWPGFRDNKVKLKSSNLKGDFTSNCAYSLPNPSLIRSTACISARLRLRPELTELTAMILRLWEGLTETVLSSKLINLGLCQLVSKA